jgi:sugar/nucleoside kinase (ribokinase family)
MRKKGSHKTKFDVLVVGELNVDIILNGMNTLPSIGSEILANEMTVTLGSSSAIFASNISTLGARTAFLGKIGEDDFGEAVLDSLQNKQIDTKAIIRSTDKKTGATIVLNYDDDRAMVTYPGAMEDLRVSEVKDHHLESAGHLHVSSVFLQPEIQKEIVSLFTRAKQKGMTTSLDVQWDPAEKWDINWEKLLPLVDVFLPNIQELLAITNTKNIDDAIAVLKPFSNTLAIKMGKEGSRGVQGDINLQYAPFLNKRIADAIGAGDSFNAGFIAAFINGKALKECLRYGNICGAVNTTAAGGTGAFISFDEVKRTAKKQFHFRLDPNF